MNTYTIVGMKHRNAEQFVANTIEGAEITLEREPANLYDTNAIKVMFAEPSKSTLRHVGYIRAPEAIMLAYMMDGKKQQSINGKLRFGIRRCPMVDIDI
jgi:hypothetical protein